MAAVMDTVCPEIAAVVDPVCPELAAVMDQCVLRWLV